jgi:hypothetical protein
MPPSRNSDLLNDHLGRDTQLSFAVYLRIAWGCAGGYQELISGSLASIEDSLDLVRREGRQGARRSWSEGLHDVGNR